MNKDGYSARALDYDLMVAMNSQTYDRDIKEVRPGGYLLYDSSWPLDPELHREDITFLGVPLAEMCNQNFDDPRERILMKNIAYAGALVAALDIDMDVVNTLLDEKFAGKKALRESNHKALQLGYQYAKEHFDCPLPFRLEKMDANGDKILIDGNTATALGCDLRRMHRGRLVSDHAGHVGDGRVQGILRAIPQRSRNRQEQLPDHPGRGRTGRHRHGAGRVLERRARVHLDRRSRHFADE